MIHSTDPIYRIYYKSYRFLSFAKNMGKCLSKSMNRKYGQKLLDTTKTFGTDALKTALKSTIQTTAEVTGDLVGNRRRKRLQRLLQRVIMRIKKIHIPEPTSIPQDTYIPSEKRQEIIDEL